MIKQLAILSILIGTLISGKTAPSEADLTGQWGCTGSQFVFMGQAGPVPDKKDADTHLRAMGATETNCVLTFSEGHKANFRLGDRSFNLNWSLDTGTQEFTVSVGWFKISGYLVIDNGKLILIYQRKDLFLMMRFLCTASGRKHIAPLGDLLDSTDGLTIAMEFSKK
ncbi:MAG: DUF4923 family protein [Bacteroidia bacterium]|nr:DUF4923 family protein [Bacteroidia bacterium]